MQEDGSRDINLIRLLAGVLLLYFAWQLLSGVINGESQHIALSICGTAAFAGIGGFLIFWELRMHRRFLGKGKKKADAEREKTLPAEQTDTGTEE